VKNSLHTIIYAAVLGIVCALLLTAAATLTDPYYKRNKEAEKMRSILTVLDVPFSTKASSQELIEIFNKNISQEKQGQLDMYKYSPPGTNGQISAVEFEGQGFWGPIKGFLSLKPDMKTIDGIVFYEQEETPGLGGDIVTEGFRNRFKGKSILNESGIPGIRMVKDGASAVNEIDGITSATRTCDKVEDMLNEVIKKLTE